ncbi:hypothetical protein T265_05922 [Opisthorchis viverrini]|uniref:Collagen triple helix repeat protein n=1 Tax=Opisthorchis viverrini TaxID=6198 RepID=A0A074ZME7_OPIVI|nr:hypothetical protein T265_05922 [Opisthorchis viverrini]KER26942.1 hypothetical protein T265_05922 [Opisthorchis viverrini]
MQVQSLPGSPSSPGFPGIPGAPTMPVSPFGPRSPIGPRGPCLPISPTGPKGPISPISPGGPMGPGGPGDLLSHLVRVLRGHRQLLRHRTDHRRPSTQPDPSFQLIQEDPEDQRVPLVQSSHQNLENQLDRPGLEAQVVREDLSHQVDPSVQVVPLVLASRLHRSSRLVPAVHVALDFPEGQGLHPDQACRQVQDHLVALEAHGLHHWLLDRVGQVLQSSLEVRADQEDLAAPVHRRDHEDLSRLVAEERVLVLSHSELVHRYQIEKVLS